MNCKICKTEKKVPYKCPKCYIRYCSLPCWKSHKNYDCQRVLPSDSPGKPERQTDTRPQPKFVTESTVPLEKLALLSKSKAVKQILENPNVRNILTEIDQSDNPRLSINKFMQEPIFEEFANACISIVEDDHRNSESDGE
ncbi:zinc finger HIT domain-containing protein 3 [Nilaparvata lugens]|uniref:zinc finger HIT domain-containing protein 3 n=1 Tax=Nilaparvata lugens TaxID=108931 RepID=UPI00193DC7F8|nr:zinc finger HIT domain-containing protein 3 [Nilaparvata lugens]